MALLTRRISAVLACGVLVSCDGTSEEGRIELERFAMPVVCEEGAECTDLGGAEVPPWPLDGWALVTTEASRHAPNGIYLYAEIPLDEARNATLEIDAPIAGADGELVADVSYVEVAGEERIFEAAAARGVVVVPAEPHAEDCGCLDAGMDIELVDAGEDGEVGTEDDAVRRLRRGRYGWTGERCGDAPALGELPEDAVVVDRQDRCAVAPRRTMVGPTYMPDVSPPPDDYYDHYYDDGSCGSSSTTASGCGSGDACNGDSSGGCGGDSSAGSGSCGGDGGSGCDGGSSSGCSGDSSAGSGSCGGDVASGSGSCGGDAGSGSCSGSDCHAAGGARRRRIPVHGGLQTMILVGLALLISRRWR